MSGLKELQSLIAFNEKGDLTNAEDYPDTQYNGRDVSVMLLNAGDDIKDALGKKGLEGSHVYLGYSPSKDVFLNVLSVVSGKELAAGEHDPKHAVVILKLSGNKFKVGSVTVVKGKFFPKSLKGQHKGLVDLDKD